jgi:Thioredoxin domain
MTKLDIVDKNVIARYGVLMSPTVVLNGTVKTMGRVPDSKEISLLIRESAK